MNTLTRSLLAAAAACAMGISMAHAQPNDQRNDHRGNQRHDQRNVQKPRAQQAPPQAHRPGAPNYRPGGAPQVRPPAYRPAPPYVQGQRGAGPNHNWYRGARVPAAYRTHHYVVNDWRGHHLSAPPRGYYWVQNGTDYLLIAIASGVISQIILGY